MHDHMSTYALCLELSLDTTMSPAASESCFEVLPRYAEPSACVHFNPYPGVEQFSSCFGYRDFLRAVAGQRTHGARRLLSLLLHLPDFEFTLNQHNVSCSTSEPEHANVYLGYLKRECEMQGQLLAGMNQIEQLSLCGAGVSRLSDKQMCSLMKCLRQSFKFRPDAAGSHKVDINLWNCTESRLEILRRAGFDHVRLPLVVNDSVDSFRRGARDLERHLFSVINQLQVAAFRSIQVDLIIGNVHRNSLMLARTLRGILEMSIDRIALRFSEFPIRKLDSVHSAAIDTLTDSRDLASLNSQCARLLVEADYVNLGMDYFALPADAHAVAQTQGRLYSNLDGFSAQADYDVISCGIATISAIGTIYTKNFDTLESYYCRIDSNELPIESGIALCMDQALRRAIMQMLMCNLVLSIKSIEQAYPITFAKYFALELLVFEALALEGLVMIDADWLCISAKGKLRVQSICQVFDQTPMDRNVAQLTTP